MTTSSKGVGFGHVCKAFAGKNLQARIPGKISEKQMLTDVEMTVPNYSIHAATQGMMAYNNIIRT